MKLSATNIPDVTTYSAWKNVPSSLRTSAQWKQRRRRVRAKEQPAAIVRWREPCMNSVAEIHTDGSSTWTKVPGTVAKTARL
jgi:hypothetical protein